MSAIRIHKMELSRGLDKYHQLISQYKRSHKQEFYRISVIKQYPISKKTWMK